MGLNFRKSVSLGKGLRLNLSKSGVGASWGIPGFRVSKTATGQTRTTVGIPGSGLSYTNTIGSKSKKAAKTKAKAEKPAKEKPAKTAPAEERPSRISRLREETAAAEPVSTSTGRAVPVGGSGRAVPMSAGGRAETSATVRSPLSHERLKTIHRSTDEAIDWSEIASSSSPTDDMYDPELWDYCHRVSAGILKGDIDTYLQVIQDLNPYDDLLDLGGGFEFGTDSPMSMTIEFTARTDEVMPDPKSMDKKEYFDLLQDYICSVTIRAARDTFALLPVNFVTVNAVDGGSTVLSVTFDRPNFQRLRFGMSDPSDLIEGFEHNMKFTSGRGFSPVKEL